MVARCGRFRAALDRLVATGGRRVHVADQNDAKSAHMPGPEIDDWTVCPAPVVSHQTTGYPSRQPW
jgi:hypothetical protein